jgi:hypothetical protein
MKHAPAIAALDEKITVLEAQLLALKRERNALGWTHRLPAELLAAVLAHVQGASGWAAYDRTWARVARVCAHWRRAALGTPTLWTTLECDAHACSFPAPGDEGAPWISLCRARAGGALLYVKNHTCAHGALLARARAAQVTFALAADFVGAGTQLMLPHLRTSS